MDTQPNSIAPSVAPHKVASVIFWRICLSIVCASAMVAGNKVSGTEPDEKAIAVLRGLENVRVNHSRFRVKATLRGMPQREFIESKVTIESEAEKYRITSAVDGTIATVAIFDGETLSGYDGDVSANISVPEKRDLSCLAFDPRTLGFSTGLFSDLSLKENLAIHSATNITMKPCSNPGLPKGLVTIELTDQFDQRIRFDMQPKIPYRVYHYSKTLPSADARKQIQYTADTEYNEDDDSWIPRKIVFSGTVNAETNETTRIAGTVEFEKPETVTEFSPATWTLAGLGLPVGQPVADLRIHQRIGYWNGEELTEDLP